MGLVLVTQLFNKIKETQKMIAHSFVRNTFIVMVALAWPISAQEIKLKSGEPRVGTTLVFELTGKLARDAKPAWQVNGPAHIDGSNTELMVKVIPDSPGPLVVMCKIRTHDGEIPKDFSIEITKDDKPKVNSDPAPQQPSVQQSPSTATEAGDIIKLGFVAAGYMGDAMSGGVVINERSRERPHSDPFSIRLDYKPRDIGWAAISWQYVTQGTMNWGETKGKNLTGQDIRSLRIWARAAKSAEGDFPTVQFKSGGGTGSQVKSGYEASYEVVDEFRALKGDWQQYCLDLSGEDLKNVVSAFTIVLTKAMNPTGGVVYLDDIHFSKQPCGK
jgi:hypothetical protein